MTKDFSRAAIRECERTLADAESVRRAKKSVELELEKRKAMRMPIAVYDKAEKKVYAAFPDGTRIEMSEYRKLGG